LQVTPVWESLGRGIMYSRKSNIRVFNTKYFTKIKIKMENNLKFIFRTSIVWNAIYRKHEYF
jgi:hypothetical protein